jgi:hypothetical protein
LNQPVGQGGFAMIDVSNDGEVSNLRYGSHGYLGGLGKCGASLAHLPRDYHDGIGV